MAACVRVARMAGTTGTGAAEMLGMPGARAVNSVEENVVEREMVEGTERRTCHDHGHGRDDTERAERQTSAKMASQPRRLHPWEGSGEHTFSLSVEYHVILSSRNPSNTQPHLPQETVAVGMEG